MRLQATTKLPAFIPFNKELMGSEFEITIGDYKGTIAFPTLQKNFENVIKMGDGLSDPHLLPPPNADVDLLKYETNWGHQCTSNGISLVKGCVVWFDLDETIDFGKFSDNLNEKIPSWLECFVLYLEILENTIYEPDDGHERKENIQFWMKKNSEIYSPRMHEILISVVFQLHGANYLNVEKAIALANTGNEPHIARLLVRNAYYYLRRDRFRESILDSASAIEISLTKKIIFHLEKDLKNKYLIQNILKKNENISGRLDLCILLDISLPLTKSEYIEKIAKIRNRVIHAGYNPQLVEAKSAHEIALQTINTLIAGFEN